MSVAEIEAEIKSLEQGDTNWQNIQRLAWLYTVHDHMTGQVPDIMPESDGEFGKILAGKDVNKVANIMSEHMAVIKILHPKEYNAVCDRLEKKYKSEAV